LNSFIDVCPFTCPIKFDIDCFGGTIPPDEHNRVVRSIQSLHILHTHILPVYIPVPVLVLYRPVCDIGISEPTQYDTDNAISYVITFEICSLLPPCSRCCCLQLDARIAVGGLKGHTHAGPAQPIPHHHTHRV